MNGKHYVGRRVSSIELYDEVGPITAVALLLDDNNEILVGDDTGYTLEVECPYGTQVMAENILAQVSGQTYKGFRAQGAELDPTAELGDGVTVDGTYSLLAYRSVNFGAGHMSEIAAPGENALDHEYQYKSPTQRQTDRKIARTRSAIEKSSEAIKLIVEELGGSYENYTELELSLDGVFVKDEDGTTRITGSCIETDTLYVDAAHINGKLTASQIDATNLVLTNSANIANNFIVDSSGNVIINGNINLSGGSITWGANNPADGSGISASEARSIASTVVTNELVASPNIVGAIITGGKITSLDEMNAECDFHVGSNMTFGLGDEASSKIMFGVPNWNNCHGLIMTDVVGGLLGNGGLWITYNKNSVRNAYLRVWSGGMELGGNVDFSNASVTGLTAKFG